MEKENIREDGEEDKREAGEGREQGRWRRKISGKQKGNIKVEEQKKKEQSRTKTKRKLK